MADPVEISDASLAAVQSRRRVELLLLLEAGSWTSADLVDQTGLTRATVMHHVRALIDAGLVREVGRVPIAGGPQRSYGTVHRGWAEAIAALNAVSAASDD